MSVKIDRPEKWPLLSIAILGGDDREQEIARLAAATGAQVKAFGFPWPQHGIEGVIKSPSAEACIKDADFCFMPIPGIAIDGSLFADEKIIPREDLLGRMNQGAHIILGKADDGLKAAAEKLNIGIHEYEHDNELMLLRAPAIVEAALRIIIDNTAFTIHRAKICVVGMGNVGSVLTRTLVALGARVTVAARNPVQRALAYTLGAEGINLNQFKESAGQFDIVMSSVPAPVVTAEVIDEFAPNTLVMDLAAPPGGVDLPYAERKGHKAIWARALGRRAPITVGGSQWVGITKIMNELIK